MDESSIFFEIERVVPVIIAVLLKGAPPQISNRTLDLPFFLTSETHMGGSYLWHGVIFELTYVCKLVWALTVSDIMPWLLCIGRLISKTARRVRRLRQESPFKVPNFVGTCVPVFIKFVHIRVFIFLVYFWIGICYAPLKFVIPRPVADPRRHSAPPSNFFHFHAVFSKRFMNKNAFQ